LVPVNYLVFRSLGRLEYAWLAVPVIAIGGAIWVARVARLDIGFARSQTEIAMIELQPNYSRGHLSRVVAIYNSLSSSYDIEFNTIDAVAAPIGNPTDLTGDTMFKVGFSEGPILSGLAVGSNQVQMVHCEQMIDMGGSISITDEDQLINQTSYELLDTFVVEKSESGELKVSALGRCGSGSTVKMRPKKMDSISMTSVLPMQSGRIIRSLASPSTMPSGSIRLVARIDRSLPGMTISPGANQALSQTMVLAHLKHQAIPPSEVDENLISDFAEVLTDELDQTTEELE